MHIESVREKVIRVIEEKRDKLIDLSRSIFEEPELKFEERRTVEKLINELKSANGIHIEKGVANLETAFVASLRGSKEGPTIAMIAEFDALPKMGHGCGHHLICTITVGAVLGLAPVINKLAGKVEVIGTPGKEGGGGKLIMHKHGVSNHVGRCPKFY